VDGLLVDAAPVFAAALAATSMEIVAAIAAKSTILLGASRPSRHRRGPPFLPAPTCDTSAKRYGQDRPQTRGDLRYRRQRQSGRDVALDPARLLGDQRFLTQFLSATMTIAYAFGMLTRSYAIYRASISSLSRLSFH